MKEIIASPNRVLHLGYEGEDNVTVIKFPYDGTWLDCGDGEFKIRVLRHGDTQAYNATEVIDDRDNMLLTMTVTDIELSVKGRGELQLVYACANAIKKSEIYRYNVNRAIDTEIDVNPPRGSVIAEVEESLAEIKDDIGELAELTTTDKSSLVSAINEVNAKESGGSVTVDDELSGTSENPVQNKVVKSKFDSVDQTVAGIGGRLATTETAIAGKADKTYVDTELAGKADSSDVETALSSKANTADVNVALSAKANSSDVNSALALKANTADMNTVLSLKANSADMQTALAGKASTDVATTSTNGLMSSTDKTKLDAVYADYSSALIALGVIDNG